MAEGAAAVRVSPAAIRAAAKRIPAEFRDSPQFVSEPLSRSLGAPVVVKVESVNPIGCFKGRGTWLAMSELHERGEVGEGRGVVVASAGNFGQGVAYAGRAMGVPVTVFAASTANGAKVAAMRRLAADVRLVGEDFDAAREAAADHAAATGWQLLVDGDDPWIAIGAGTMASELTDAVDAGDLPDFRTIYVPVGNGALVGGIGAWVRHAPRPARVVGVQAAGASAMYLSWRARTPVATEHVDTIADGIAARVPVERALALMLEVVDEMLLVDDPAIIAATEEMSAALPVSVEPSAAASWAAARRVRPTDPVCLVLTGGNV